MAFAWFNKHIKIINILRFLISVGCDGPVELSLLEKFISCGGILKIILWKFKSNQSSGS